MFFFREKEIINYLVHFFFLLFPFDFKKAVLFFDKILHIFKDSLEDGDFSAA